MTLHEQMTEDISLLLNADEFGDEHEVAGVTLICVLDSIIDQPRGGEAWSGVATARRVLYCDPSDLPARPAVGAQTTLDGDTVAVVDVIEEGALLKLTLERVPAPVQTQTCTVTHYTSDGWNTPSASSTEANIPCRVIYAQEQVPALNAETEQVALSTARVVFGPSSGLVTIVIGDTVTINSTVYRVIKTAEERDIAASCVTRTAWLAI